MNSSISRRRLVGGGIAAAAGAAFGSSFLAACSTNGSQAPGSADTADANVKLPTYAPSQPVKPDLPAEPEGVQPAYYTYPDPPKQQFSGPVGQGDKLSLFTVIASGLPTTKGKNSYWQAIDKAVGADIDINFVPPADYADKLATTISGGQLPDLLQIFTPPPHLSQLLKAEFTDLTPFLSGAAIKDYPNLAAIPTQSWQATVFNGGIYAVPIPRALVGPIVLRRDDVIAGVGIDSEPATFAEFKQQAKAVTTSKRWALGAADGARVLIQQMLGMPNGWKQENGTFTYGETLPEAKEALARVVELIKDGLFHPDALLPGADIKQWFGTGKIVWHYDNYPAWPDFFQRFASVSPKMDIGGFIPPGFDAGTKPTLWQGGGYFAFNALKKAKPERIRQLLTVMNWFAAPFGTSEYLLRKFGVEGEHFTFVDGAPVPLKAAASQLLVPFGYLADAPEVIFEPGREAVARKQHGYQVRAVPKSVPNATTGLYSETNGTKGAQLAMALSDARTEIFNQRQPVDSYDKAVAAWKSGGGDTIKTEYEKAYAATQ